MTEKEAEDFYAIVFRGKHHIPGKLRNEGSAWRSDQVSWSISMPVDGAGCSTFDFDELTRLVFLAHDRCYRLTLTPGGPRRVRVMITNRDQSSLDISGGHPTLDEAVAKWRERRDESWTRTLFVGGKRKACDGTPESNHERLTAHVKTCAKHPLRDQVVRLQVALREALEGWENQAAMGDDPTIAELRKLLEGP